MEDGERSRFEAKFGPFWYDAKVRVAAGSYRCPGVGPGSAHARARGADSC